MMHLATPAAFAVAALLFVSAAADSVSAAESGAGTGTSKTQAVLGTWEGVEIGREAAGKSRITFEGDSIHFQGADPAEWYKATFTTPAAAAGAEAADQNQNQLVAKISECPFPQFVGKSSYFIYKVEDGKLTLVGHKPGDPNPPKSFEGDATSRTFVFTKGGGEIEETRAHPLPHADRTLAAISSAAAKGTLHRSGDAEGTPRRRGHVAASSSR